MQVETVTFARTMSLLPVQAQQSVRPGIIVTPHVLHGPLCRHATPMVKLPLLSTLSSRTCTGSLQHSHSSHTCHFDQ